MQHGEDCICRGVVAKRAANVRISIDVAGAKYKGATELERIRAQTMLPVTGRTGTSARLCILGAKKM